MYMGDLAGMVHAVDNRDGKPLWTFKTGGEIKSSPILVKELVLIGSYDGHLYAIEARTGKLRWKVVTEGPVHATPAVQGDLVFIAGCDEKFRAIRVSDGKQEYRDRLGRVHRRIAGASTATGRTSGPSTTRSWRST